MGASVDVREAGELARAPTHDALCIVGIWCYNREEALLQAQAALLQNGACTMHHPYMQPKGRHSTD